MSLQLTRILMPRNIYLKILTNKMSDISLQESVYPETAFGGFSRIDGTVSFLTRVQALASSSSKIVDIGCGRGSRKDDTCAWRRRLADLRTTNRMVLGIDISAEGKDNPFVDDFRQLRPDEAWPIDGGTVDLAIADYVLEHVEHPAFFISEVSRILKPGAYFCARTPNKWGYVALVSLMVPQRMHGGVVARVQEGRQVIDVFPTFYRLNTVGTIRRLLQDHGFTSAVYTAEGEPNYLREHAFLYRVGAVVHGWLPGFLRSTILAFARRPEEGAS
jgi:SAM-dependent methyltransferase